MPRSGAQTHNPKTDPNYFTLPGNYNGVKLTSEHSVILLLKTMKCYQFVQLNRACRQKARSSATS